MLSVMPVNSQLCGCSIGVMKGRRGRGKKVGQNGVAMRVKGELVVCCLFFVVGCDSIRNILLPVL